MNNNITKLMNDTHSSVLKMQPDGLLGVSFEDFTIAFYQNILNKFSTLVTSDTDIDNIVTWSNNLNVITFLQDAYNSTVLIVDGIANNSIDRLADAYSNVIVNQLLTFVTVPEDVIKINEYFFGEDPPIEYNVPNSLPIDIVYFGQVIPIGAQVIPIKPEQVIETQTGDIFVPVEGIPVNTTPTDGTIV